MKWISGGDWLVVDIPRSSAVEYVAFLLPVSDTLDRLSPQRLAEHLNAAASARSFLDSPERWAREVGAPASLQVYEPTRHNALNLLGEMQKMSEEFEVEFKAKPLEECDPARRDRIIGRLVQMLRKWGPLRGIAEVLDLNDAGVKPPEEWAPRYVSLDMLVSEVAHFGELYRLVKTEGIDGARLARRMQLESADAARDVRVVTELDEDEVRFVPHPITLRAFLWEVLFDLNTRRPGNCLVCKADFESLRVRGRPFAYCAEHRQSKYRTAMYEKKVAKRRK